MKILLASRSSVFHEGHGGMEVIAHELAIEWTRAGHEVIYVTTPVEGLSGPIAAPYVLRQLRGNSGRYTTGWARRLSRLSIEDYDVVFGVSAAARRLLKADLPAPIVMQAHGTSVDEIRSKLRQKNLLSGLKTIKNFSWLLLDLADYRRYDAVVGVGASVTNTMLRTIPSSLRPRVYLEIPNGVRKSRHHGVVDPSAREAIVFVGRVHREKGILELVAALVRTDDWLIVCGDGPALEESRALARKLGVSSRVRFVGRVTQTQSRDYMRRAKLVVVPSIRLEGLPLVVLESLTEGTPVLVDSTIADSLPTDLRDGVYSFDRGEAEGLAASIRLFTELSMTDHQRIKISAARYTIEMRAYEYLALFDRVRVKFGKAGS